MTIEEKTKYAKELKELLVEDILSRYLKPEYLSNEILESFQLENNLSVLDIIELLFKLKI